MECHSSRAFIDISSKLAIADEKPFKYENEYIKNNGKSPALTKSFSESKYFLFHYTVVCSAPPRGRKI